jgi:hypothetical protein
MSEVSRAFGSPPARNRARPATAQDGPCARGIATRFDELAITYDAPSLD